MVETFEIIKFLRLALEAMKGEHLLHKDFKCPPLVPSAAVVEFCKKVDIPCVEIDHGFVALGICHESFAVSEKKR